MNERIKELMAQASYNIVETNGAPIVSNEFNKEKFAELMLKECVKSIEYTIQTNCDTDSEKMGCEFAISDLKERFGVN
jgi:hypothetical protein